MVEPLLSTRGQIGASCLDIDRLQGVALAIGLTSSYNSLIFALG